MGRTGSALDNAVAESFNSTLQFELLADARFTTLAQARAAVAAFLDEYNNDRRHSSAAGCRRRFTRPGSGRSRRRDHSIGGGFACGARKVGSATLPANTR